MFFTKSSNTAKIKKLENKAKDILQLPNEMKALRIDDEVVVIDSSKNKIVSQLTDVFPSNPARATVQIMKKLNLASEKENKKEIWSCGFRESETRWVWYKNSQPKMTVSFDEAYPEFDSENANHVECKIDFCLAKYGTVVVDRIKSVGVEKIADDIHALVLENSYTTIKCGSCKVTENYTIDDIVDDNKKAKYDSNFVICNNCGELIKLL